MTQRSHTAHHLVELVFSRGVQDGDAHLAVGVDCATGARRGVRRVAHVRAPRYCHRRVRRTAQNALLGCHMSLVNFISGGWLGKSSGNLSSALKKPSSLTRGTAEHASHGEHGPRQAAWGSAGHSSANTVYHSKPRPRLRAGPLCSVQNALVCADRAHDHDVPLEQVVILQPHADALWRRFVHLCARRAQPYE